MATSQGPDPPSASASLPGVPVPTSLAASPSPLLRYLQKESRFEKYKIKPSSWLAKNLRVVRSSANERDGGVRQAPAGGLVSTVVIS